MLCYSQLTEANHKADSTITLSVNETNWFRRLHPKILMANLGLNWHKTNSFQPSRQKKNTKRRHKKVLRWRHTFINRWFPSCQSRSLQNPQKLFTKNSNRSIRLVSVDGSLRQFKWIWSCFALDNISRHFMPLLLAPFKLQIIANRCRFKAKRVSLNSVIGFANFFPKPQRSILPSEGSTHRPYVGSD